MQRTHHQRFCTACAAPLELRVHDLPPMWSAKPRDLSLSESPSPTALRERNHGLTRLLGVAPIVLLVAVTGGLLERHNAEQQWLASTYEAAASAAAGRQPRRRRATHSASSPATATSTIRISEIDKQLEPLEAAYLDGLQAIDEGNYAAAVDLLQPVADQAPGLKDVVVQA